MKRRLILIILIVSFLCGIIWFYLNIQETVIDQIIINDPKILTYDQIWELIEKSENIEHIEIDEETYYKNEKLFNQVMDDFNTFLEQEENKIKNKEVIKKR